MAREEHPGIAVLVVDDDPDFLTVIQDLLQFRLGDVRVDTAPSAAEGLARVSHHDYDVVISDIRMPDMDGLTLTSKMLEVSPDTPTILVTAHGDRDLGVKALNSGAYAYIQKPIDREYLICWIRRAVHMRRLARALDRQRRDLEQRTAELEDANRALREQIAEHQQVERTLRESEERFRLLVQEVRDYAIFLLDTEGRVVSWNLGAEMMKGYRADEIIGHSFSRFYTDEDRRAERPLTLLRKAREAGRVEDEGWRVRKDGTRFWANVVITALHDTQKNLRGYAKITRNLTDRRRMEEEIQQTVGRLERRDSPSRRG